jgi:hypothetical protein
MKLKTGIYPNANPKEWLVFSHPEQVGISLELARRLAAYAQSKNRKLTISSGYRDVVYQKKLYDQNCKEHPPSGNGYVARPGNSWHNGRCAVDVGGTYWKALHEKGDMLKTAKQQELAKFGLYLPLNRKDASTVFEWWHIQPIELLGYSGDRTKYLDTYDLIYKPKEEIKMSWQEIIEKVSSGRSADWEKAINTAVKAAEADGNLGDLEIFKYLPQLIEGIYNMKGV